MTQIVNLFLLAAAVHFVADFPFQADWMAANKGKNWEILAYHCLVYTATFVLASGLLDELNVQLLGLLVIFVTHMIIDALKARYQLIKKIWQDQLLHFAVIAVLVAIGWIN